MRALFGVLLIALSQPANSQSWAAQDAKLTTEEFLQTYLELGMQRHENSTALNSFNLVTFLPGTSPSTAIVFVVQTYNVGGRSTEDPALRRGIRKVAAAELESFEARFGLPILKKRWSPSNPRAHFVMKHVRVDDIQDVLAVTVSGETSFEADRFKEAATQVRAAGGVWSW